MAKFIVSALGTEALATTEIEAETVAEAVQIYQDQWAAGFILPVDYEIDHFTVTDEDGKDEIINY